MAICMHIGYTDKNGNKRRVSKEQHRKKLGAEAHIDELLKVSYRSGAELTDDTKNHPFAKDGWDYRQAYFVDYDGTPYRVTISVGYNSGVITAYNVGKLNKTAFAEGLKARAMLQNKSAMEGNAVSDDSIQTSERIVNEKFSLKMTPTLKKQEDEIYEEKRKLRDEEMKLRRKLHNFKNDAKTLELIERVMDAETREEKRKARKEYTAHTEEYGVNAAEERIREIGAEIRSLETKENAGLFEQARYGKEIRINGMSDWLLGRKKQVVQKANENIEKQNNCYIASGTKRAGLSLLQQGAAYGVLIWKVLAGELGIGTFTMCISAVTSFADAMRGLMDQLTEIRAYDFYYEQLDEYLHIPQLLREGKRLPAPGQAHRIEFRDVGFRYRGAEKWALRHINLCIEPGQRLALVGENGSGKSTLIKLLCRLYAPTEGMILMDGVDIREYDYDQYLAQFAAVFQDFELFECSVRDNILLGKDMAEDQLNEIIDQVGLKQKIRSLPCGVDTTVGRQFDEKGFEPSGGEAQKMVLARAICKDAPMIILDEPTAAMDPRAEYDLYKRFDALISQKTAVYISHRMSVCRFCDCIAVLHQGALAEYGTHSTLMKNEGRYAEMYRMQAQYYTE